VRGFFQASSHLRQTQSSVGTGRYSPVRVGRDVQLDHGDLKNMLEQESEESECWYLKSLGRSG